MMRSVLTAAIIAVLFGFTAPALAQNGAGIVLHVTDADFSQGCSLVDTSTLTCGDVNVVGSGGESQLVWVIAYGWRTIPGWGDPDVGLSAVAFALSYPPETDVVTWFGCADQEIPLDDKVIGTWPESNTGLALTFAEAGGVNPESGFVTLGYLLVDAGSSGRMSVAPFAAAPIDAVEFVSADAITFQIPETGYSSVDVGGDSPTDGFRACEGVIPSRTTSWGAIKSAF